jgi:hypothetical protein
VAVLFGFGAVHWVAFASFHSDFASLIAAHSTQSLHGGLMWQEQFADGGSPRSSSSLSPHASNLFTFAFNCAISLPKHLFDL